MLGTISAGGGDSKSWQSERGGDTGNPRVPQSRQHLPLRSILAGGGVVGEAFQGSNSLPHHTDVEIPLLPIPFVL